MRARRLGWAVALCAATLGGGCGHGGPDLGQVVTAAVQDLVLDVEVAGSLRTLDPEHVGPPSAVTDTSQFKITRLIAEGTQVKPGTEVIAFDETMLEKYLTDRESDLATYTEELGKLRANNALTVLNDRMALEEARAQLRKAELKADRPADLTAQLDLKIAVVELKMAQREVAFQLASQQDKRRQESAEQAILEGRLARSRATVDNVKAELLAMSVKARRAGTVVYEQTSRGEKKKVGDRVWRSDNVLEIAALDRLAVQGHIDEVDASNVAVGQRVRLQLESHTDREYVGTVERVADLVQTESAESRVKVVQLDIKLTEIDPLVMRPGTRVRGHIETAREHGVLQLPLAAIVSTAGGPVVTRVDGRHLVPTVVTLGRRSREMVEVKAGLKAGDRVLLRPAHGSSDKGSSGASVGSS